MGINHTSPNSLYLFRRAGQSSQVSAEPTESWRDLVKNLRLWVGLKIVQSTLAIGQDFLKMFSFLMNLIVCLFHWEISLA